MKAQPKPCMKCGSLLCTAKKVRGKWFVHCFACLHNGEKADTAEAATRYWNEEKAAV